MNVISYEGKEPKIIETGSLERVLAIIEAQLEIIKTMTTTTLVIKRGTSVSTEETK